MKTMVIIELFVVGLISLGCYNSRLELELKKTIEVFELEYEINIHGHFPEKIKNANFIHSYLIRPDSFSYFGSSFVTVRAGKEEISEILQKYPDCKSIRDNEFFVVDCGLFRDCENYDSLRSYNESVPIPDFQQIDFRIGETIDSAFSSKVGGYLPIVKYILPDDLSVIIIESQSGNFWKTKHNERRCTKITPWQNGYSYGYAISEKYNYITYWAIAW
jgi:hypothetical protein